MSRFPMRVRSITDDHGQTYISLDDLRAFTQDRDAIYTAGCVMKVHMESRKPTPPMQPGWKGAVTAIMGAVLMAAVGETEVITDPESEKGRN